MHPNSDCAHEVCWCLSNYVEYIDFSIFLQGRHFEYFTLSDQHEITRFFLSISTRIMAEYFKDLQQLLALSGESFEEELRRLVSFICFAKTISFLTTTKLPSLSPAR